MAAESPVESLQEEATCPLCLEYFTDPMITDCGHNFCRGLSQCWEGPSPAITCPQCRETVQQRNFRPTRQLANIVELVKRLSLQAPKGAGGEHQGVCGEHQEALKLFCNEDQTPICVICHLFQAHHAHRVLPIQEAAQEYQGKIQAHLKALREEREKLLGWKATGEGRSQEYLISRLSEWIGELEGTCQKPASEFLQSHRHRPIGDGKAPFAQGIHGPGASLLHVSKIPSLYVGWGREKHPEQV
ncbi:zinc finger protein RFP-like isoform X2 [Pelodiscus sinensis]